MGFTFLLIFLHIGKNLCYRNYYIINAYNVNLVGFLILMNLVVIGFIGYVLSWGQISYWDTTVILNIINVNEKLMLFILGNYVIYSGILNRLLILHFALSMVLVVGMVVHINYIHAISSQNMLGINNTISSWLSLNSIDFAPYILLKDVFGLLVVLNYMLYQPYFMVVVFLNPNNFILVNNVSTPLHINPEWYFLLFYFMIKVIPSKLNGLCWRCSC